MERQWFYAVNGQQNGPISEDEFVRLFQENHLSADTLVWTEKLPGWVAASSVKELWDSRQVTVPPPLQGNVPLSPDRGLYAGFWKRFAACLIDSIILGVGGMVIGFVFGLIYGVATGSAKGVELFGNIIGIIIGWLYYAACESSATQATPGKMALGIKVTDLAGMRISFGSASGRHFGKIISGLCLGIGYLSVAFSERKQGWHDMWANCLVVNK